MKEEVRTDEQAVSDMLMSYFMKGDIKGTQCSEAQAKKYFDHVVKHQKEILKCLDFLAYHIVHDTAWWRIKSPC